MLFQVVPCTMSVRCSLMGLYPVNGHIISRCSVYNVCKLLCDGLYPVHGHVISRCSVYNVCKLFCNGLYPVHGHVISCCSGYNVCKLLRDGIISSTWSCYFTLFRVMSVSCSVITFSSTRCYITFNHVHSLCAVSLYFYFNMCDSLCVIFFLSLFLSTAILNVIVANVWTLD